MAAACDAPVLISAYSLDAVRPLAFRIHSRSARRHAPFIRLDGASVSEGRGAELFADVSRQLACDPAGPDAGGTVLLTRVDHLPLDAQQELLHFMERHDGADAAFVRVIAATNRPLLDDVQDGRFNRDLYYRLNVIHIVLTGLSDRATMHEDSATGASAMAATALN